MTGNQRCMALVVPLGPTSGLYNNGLHQTRREGAVASRPIVEARLAGEAECCAHVGGWQ